MQLLLVNQRCVWFDQQKYKQASANEELNMPFSIMYPFIPILTVLMFPEGEFPETGLELVDRNVSHLIDYYSDEMNFVDRFDELIIKEARIAEMWSGSDYDDPGLTFDIWGYVNKHKGIKFNQRLNFASYQNPAAGGRNVYVNFQLDSQRQEIFIEVMDRVGSPPQKRVIGSYANDGLVTWLDSYQPKCTYTRFKYRIDRMVHQVLARKLAKHSNFWEFTCAFNPGEN